MFSRERDRQIHRSSREDLPNVEAGTYAAWGSGSRDNFEWVIFLQVEGSPKIFYTQNIIKICFEGRKPSTSLQTISIQKIRPKMFYPKDLSKIFYGKIFCSKDLLLLNQLSKFVQRYKNTVEGFSSLEDLLLLLLAHICITPPKVLTPSQQKPPTF